MGPTLLCGPRGPAVRRPGAAGGGGTGRASILSLIVTAKLNDVDP